MEVQKVKKRKAERAVSVKLEPDQKKVKRSLSETDEQWQKYVKQKSVPTKQPRVTTPTVKKEPKAKKKKKSNSLLKQREPCDLMRNERRVEELQRHVEVIANINEENCEQKTLAINLMPVRARQTAETLSIGEDKASHIVYNDVDFCMEMKRMNYERSAAAANANAEQSYALQDLMGDQGFFSVNNEHVDQVLACIVKETHIDISYANKLTQAESARKQQQQQKKNNEMVVVGGDTSNKKLNCIFGGVFYSFGYNKRTPQLQYKKLNSEDAIDREERFKEFYRCDQLERETMFGVIPDDFKMFRELKRQNTEKYEKRNETLKYTAALTPKTDIEIISREYIASFRQPPIDGEECCANREQCVFNTFSNDKNVCYIGKVFYTENERVRRLKHQEQDDEGNTHRLCYDCLIAKWTIEWALNIQHEIVPERAINYFCVMCKPGQYSAHCMLSMIENDKFTGIVGHVTRFSHNNRRIVTHVRHTKRDGKYHQISVPVLDETGMDF